MPGPAEEEVRGVTSKQTVRVGVGPCRGQNGTRVDRMEIEAHDAIVDDRAVVRSASVGVTSRYEADQCAHVGWVRMDVRRNAVGDAVAIQHVTVTEQDIAPAFTEEDIASRPADQVVRTFAAV